MRRAAVIGSGPAGFYATAALLASDDPAFAVDLYDRLPTPWGLVRAGVAPDHPKIKAVTRVFERIAQHDRFRFFGHVTVGDDVKRAELLAHYDAVVWAYGADADRRMGIEGEELPGSIAATALVGWYNGHPDWRELELDLSCERVVVIGNGNVAIDVARMLAVDPDELATTDVADHALAELRASKIREIVVCGRRGPAQAAFTSVELGELGELAGVDVVVSADEGIPDEASAQAIAGEGHPIERRNLSILQGYIERGTRGAERRIVLRFLVSPTRILGAGRVEAIELARTRLEPGEGGVMRAVATDERETIPCGMVVRSVGYLGRGVPGVPFDERRGVIPNERGRVLEATAEYCTGWIKRGPSGIIGTNKKDANETVGMLLADVRAGVVGEADHDPAEIEALVRARQPDVVELAGWNAIDAVERALGEPHGRPRAKLATFAELLRAARG